MGQVMATNVVFFLVDDLGFMDVGFNHPHGFYETPQLDRLAGQSMRFTAAYAAAPVCSPTRSSILTGQHPARTRNTDYFGAPNEFQRLLPDYRAERDGKFAALASRPLWPAPYLGRLAAEHTTLPEALRPHGYITMHAGKWHLGPLGSYPEDHVFDVNVGGYEAGGPYGGKKYFSPYGNPRLSDGPEGEHLPDRLATEVIRFIDAHQKQPFFVYMPFYSVHTPLMAREDHKQKYLKKKAELGLKAAFAEEYPRQNRTVQEHAVYAAMIEAMDEAVGRVLAALEQRDLARDTIVVFFSDNGGLSTSEGSPTSNLPFRAGKGWAYEGGVRVPLLVRWPGVVSPGTVCNVPVLSTDFYPTLLQACELPPLPQQHRDGISFVDLLKNPEARSSRAPLFWHYPHWGNQGGIPYSAVRDGEWKLIRYYWKKGTELYHLGQDPSEKHNVAAQNAETVQRLNRLLDGFLQDTTALMPTVNPHAAADFTSW